MNMLLDRSKSSTRATIPTNKVAIKALKENRVAMKQETYTYEKAEPDHCFNALVELERVRAELRKVTAERDHWRAEAERWRMTSIPFDQVFKVTC